MNDQVVVALPTSGDSSVWTDSEKALVEAAGLTTGNGQNKRLAPRPVVEAFLLHARRTGLDPIARQIYCIERGGKWGTQVSIDGARLVAERTGQYKGQTPTQWTDDGVTWLDVWLAKTPPAAARVGVFREGFTEPLVAVATFDAYNAGSPIWRKMPALMLGKCAEMLALRKAFPQDLSGLYSTEEMQQAGAGSNAPAEPPVVQPKIERVRVATKDWETLAQACGTYEELYALYQQAEGELGVWIREGDDRTVSDVLTARREELVPKPEPKTETIVVGESAPSDAAEDPEVVALRERAAAAAAERDAAKNQADETLPPRAVDPETGEELI